MVFTTRNPYTNQKVQSYQTLSNTEVTRLIEGAHQTYMRFRHLGPESRQEKMLNVRTILLDHKIEYARLITEEMGKPLTQSIAEIEKCALVCEHYAYNAGMYLKDKSIETEDKSINLVYEPSGVILGIMPWNYPFWQVFRVLAPNLMLGNSVVIKHAENTLGCGELIKTIIKQAGFKPHSFTHVVIEEHQTEHIIANPLVKGVSFTGSTRGGSEVAKLAGKHIKKSVLELGGNNAFVVFDDADIQAAVQACIRARFQNTGQSCIAGKRLLLHKNIYTQFIDLLVQEVQQISIGNPNEPDTYLSVLAREDLAEHLKSQLELSITKGAKLIYGGHQDGTYFEPTLVESADINMPIFNEETFGPLLAITSFETEQQALDIINTSAYGLGASIFTKKQSRFKHMAKQIDDGAVFMNAMVKSNPKYPFGGTKKSGYGRELGEQGILEFANIKTIAIDK